MWNLCSEYLFVCACVIKRYVISGDQKTLTYPNTTAGIVNVSASFYLRTYMYMPPFAVNVWVNHIQKCLQLCVYLHILWLVDNMHTNHPCTSGVNFSSTPWAQVMWISAVAGTCEFDPLLVVLRPLQRNRIIKFSISALRCFWIFRIFYKYLLPIPINLHTP